MIGKVKSAVKKVMDVASDFIGFNSPSKKGEGRFITVWGENMVGGFIDGINASLPKLNAVMSNVIPTMDSSTMASAGSGVVNNNNTSYGSIIVQNMQVSQPSDIQDVAKELFRLQSRNGRGLGIV